ncbi:unnamed protein product [Arctogadus glacialis]
MANPTAEDLNSEEPNIGQKEHVKNTSAGLMTSGSSGEGSSSKWLRPLIIMDSESSYHYERSRSTHGEF